MKTSSKEPMYKKFDYSELKPGVKAWHVSRNVEAANVTRVGNRIAFTLPDDGDYIYQCSLDGTYREYGEDEVVLALVEELVRVEHPMLMWVASSEPFFTTVVLEKRGDGDWIIVGTRELEEEALNQESAA